MIELTIKRPGSLLSVERHEITEAQAKAINELLRSGDGTRENPHLTDGPGAIQTLRFLSMALRWAVFRDAPRVETSNEMRVMRERTEAALNLYDGKERR